MTALMEAATRVEELAARDGIARADRGASDAWRAKALAAVALLAHERPSFMAADVWEEGLELPESGKAQALGGVMRRAVSAGLIRRSHFVGEWRRGQPGFAGHTQTAVIWESRVYGTSA